MNGPHERLDRLRERISKEPIDGLLVTDPVNWRYISGFRGDAGTLLITGKGAYVFTDSRYIEQAEHEAPGFTCVMTAVDTDEVKVKIEEDGVKRLGFEQDRVSYTGYLNLGERLPGVELVPLRGIVEDLRVVKSDDEVACIQKAQDIADRAFALLIDSIRIGATELELALELEFAMRKMGSEGVSFPIIAVAGERSSLPHGVPTVHEARDGDFVTFDFGACYDGYRSDETRTVVMGHLDKKHEEVYKIVLEAQMAGLDAVKPGAAGVEVDAVARKIIEDAGYGPNFGHGLGHGTGLRIHEGPSLSKISKDILRPGMIVTIEPGIYIPGFGGCRIEDIVLVTEGGKRILSHSPKDLRVLDTRQERQAV